MRPSLPSRRCPPRSIATSVDRPIRLEAWAALPNADRPSSLALMMSVGTGAPPADRPARPDSTRTGRTALRVCAGGSGTGCPWSARCARVPRVSVKAPGHAEDLREQGRRVGLQDPEQPVRPEERLRYGLWGCARLAGRAEASRISAVVRSAWRNANWMAGGPPPEYPNTAARSMPSASRSSAYASAWPAGTAAGARRSQVPEARRSDEPVTGADVGLGEAGHHVKAPKQRVARIIAGPSPHSVYSMAPKRGSRRTRRSQSASRRRAASMSRR